MTGKVRVMLVDDHAVVRTGFRMLLESTQDLEVVCEAESGEAAYQEYQAVQPAVVVMDISISGMNGVQATQRIVAWDRNARILGLSSHEDPSQVRFMLKAGALGYLSKRSAPEALIDAIRLVASGQMYLDAQLAKRMALQEFQGEKHPLDLLSEREFGVFIQLAKGASANQIADILKLSPRTVGTHLYHIKQKLCAANQSELTLIAIRHGLISA